LPTLSFSTSATESIPPRARKYRKSANTALHKNASVSERPASLLARPCKSSEGHPFELDKTLCWHGWHSFRRGLATNLYALGVDDKTIQAILRHSNVGLTMNVYVKSVSESQVTAMDALSKKLGLCNVCATNEEGPVN
jgi:hypothetical protein